MGDGESALEGMVMTAPHGQGLPRPAFWAGKRVLLTGHTGFKGAWLALWLSGMGARVTGFSLAPVTDPHLYGLLDIETLVTSHIGDIRVADGIRAVVSAADPEIVLHLAAQPLVRESYARPIETFATNVLGTAHVLDALRGQAGCRVAVVVTTDKVYRNDNWHYPYREIDTLGGHDPYSASKAAAEIVAASYRAAFFDNQGVAVATARAGNVIGGGDWSADRLVPDAVRAWQNRGTLEVRRPGSVRPWQHVLEPLAGYLVLAERLWVEPALAGAYNFGPLQGEAASVRTVVDLAREVYGMGEAHFAQAEEGPHEAQLLSLDVSKARGVLGVAPRWTLRQSVERTMRWYRRQHAGEAARALCGEDIAGYVGASQAC